MMKVDMLASFFLAFASQVLHTECSSLLNPSWLLEQSAPENRDSQYVFDTDRSLHKGWMNAFSDAHDRWLQSSTTDANRTTLSPDAVCEAYNEQYQNMSMPINCTCARFAADQVSVNCSLLEEQCNSDESYCYLAYINTILNSTGQSRVTTSCTNATRDVMLNTCVQYFPSEPGDYSEISECYASLNDKSCNYCDVCPKNNSSTGFGSATINCCNVQADAIATCLPYSDNGATYVLYDSIASANKGQCTGSQKPPSSANTKNSFFLLFCTVMTAILGMVML